ncbi:hypothetical protein V2J09_006289 [Rumex salicifolius]
MEGQKNNKNKGDQDVKHEEASDGECYSITSEYSSNWILDIGCSYHMCPNRKWFTSYKAINGGTVLMGNGHGCETVGIGTIRIKMHDGIVRTLMDVRHVPDLRKNLISLGVLESKGCKLIGENEVLKVVNGSLMVMSHLVGSIAIGYVAVGIVGSKRNPIEYTRLWHMRLGHMSEKGLNLLGKKDLLKYMKKPCMEFCEHCLYGKAHRVLFSTINHKSRGIIDYVHTDV